MSSAMPDVSSVPTTSGSAPYWPREGTQSFENTNCRTPVSSNAGLDSTSSRMKKKPMRTRTPAAIAASTHCSSGSAKRGPDPRGSVPRVEVIPAASTAPRSARRDRGAVADEAIDLRLGLLLDRVGQRRVLQLGRDRLAGALGVVQPVLDEPRLRGVETGLADVLVDEQERDRRDRVGRGARRVDRAEAQVGGRLGSGAGGRGRLERRRDELAGLVLHGRGREV